jgi:mono/diheme cytochrome c family protein
MKTLAFLTVLFAGVTALAPFGLAQGVPSDRRGPQQPTAPASSTGNADNGKKLFLRDGCWECHGYAGQGGRDGARLAETALTAGQFTRYIRRPAGAMPAYIEKVLSDAEAADIWAYVKTMTGPKTAKDVPLLLELKGQ